MSKDAFYTPEWLAEAVISLSERRRANIVADFAAGDGALLRAAEMRWQSATIVAADLCDASVRRLRKKYKLWQCTKCDFLDLRSRARSNLLRSLLGQVDQIILNPPFSCRGGTSCAVNTPHGIMRCGRALAFLIAALEYLRPGGELIAVLPSNVLDSQKDRESFGYLRRDFHLTTHVATSSSDFSGCRVKYVLVSLTCRKKSLASYSEAESRRSSESNTQLHVRLVRGTSQMHNLPALGRTLVHTTDMRDHKVELNGHYGHPERPSVIGPAVLLPRVGAPRIDKACIYLRRKRITLSDCVIGLQCESPEDARWLLAAFCKNLDCYTAMFSGTCAPYVTVERLSCLLQKLGCVVEDGNALLA
jgi:predicted RNA methylase